MHVVLLENSALNRYLLYVSYVFQDCASFSYCLTTTCIIATMQKGGVLRSLVITNEMFTLILKALLLLQRHTPL